MDFKDITDKITRFVLVDWSKSPTLGKGDVGRLIDQWDVKLQLSLQDDGKTLKVFLLPKHSETSQL